MPNSELPAILSHQVLADPSGRRRRRLAVAGRAAIAVLGLWLVVLILGGLGLQPLAGIPVVGDIGGGAAGPPKLPERVRAAVPSSAAGAPASHRSVTPGPGRSGGAPSPRARSRSLPADRRTTTRRSPGRRLGSPAPATPRPNTTAPGQTKTAPGQTHTAPGQTQTAPGQTRTAPGQTKTAPGPPATTPHGNVPQGGAR